MGDPSTGSRHDTPLIAEEDESLPKTKGKRELTWWRLAVITFMYTCSGPGGLEQTVKAGGPGLTLLGLFLMPVLYVMPQIFVVSELGAMMPTAGGNVVWVERAFGRAAGFYNAWIFALTNMVDIGAYPALFGDYVVSTFFPQAGYATQITWRLIGLVSGAAMALASAKDVSSMTAIGCLAVSVFALLMFCAGWSNIDPSTQWVAVEPNVDFSLLGSSLMWLYTGWTALGALAGETKNSRVLPYGMSSALALDLAVYVMSLFAALTVSRPSEWDTGFFVTVMDRLLPGSAIYFGVSVIIGSMALYLSAILCYSRTLWGMAMMGWAPGMFSQQLPNGAPHVAVLGHFAVGLILIWFDLGFIVQVEYTVAASSYILTYLAFIKLRYAEPLAPRPYKTPGGMTFAWLITVTKILVMGGTMVAGLLVWPIFITAVVINVAVGLAYVALCRMESYENTASTIEGDTTTLGKEGSAVVSVGRAEAAVADVVQLVATTPETQTPL